MNEVKRPNNGYRSLGIFQLRLVERWVIITLMAGVLGTFTVFQMTGFSAGQFWFLMFILSALLFTPVIIGVLRGQMDIFEPIFLVSAAYFLYFVWAPSGDYIKGNYTIFGIDILTGLWTGTMHACVGVAALMVGYYVKFGNRKVTRPTGPLAYLNDDSVSMYRSGDAIRYALILIIVAIFCLGLTFKLTGWNWSRLLTFGQYGDQLQDIWLIEQNPFLNYLHSTLEWFLPAFLVLMVFHRPSPRSRFLLAIGFLMVFAIYTTLGFRYRVLLLMMAPVTYHYMVKRKRPGVMGLAVAGAITVLMIGIIGGTRGATRTGGRIDSEDFQVEQSSTNFTHDLRLYPPYYKMLDVVPTDVDFLLGSSYLYVFIAPIPRALWPGKPDAPVRNVLRMIIGERAVTQGLAYPNLGELYVNFGFFGEILGMFLFGYLLQRLWIFTQSNAHDPWALILYVMWLPFLVQVVSRGYFVQIAQEIAFIFLPVMCGRHVLGEPSRRRALAALPVPLRRFGVPERVPSR